MSALPMNTGRSCEAKGRPTVRTDLILNPGPGYHVHPVLAIMNVDQDYVPNRGWMTLERARAFARTILREADRIEVHAESVRRAEKAKRERARDLAKRVRSKT